MLGYSYLILKLESLTVLTGLNTRLLKAVKTIGNQLVGGNFHLFENW